MNKKKGRNLVFYDNLKAECNRRGIKVTPLIQKCGGSTGKISSWKKGASPNSDIVMKIAKRLNVSTDYLLFGSEAEDFNENELQLIRDFRVLNDEGQEDVLDYVHHATTKSKYQKYTDVPKEA